MILADWIAGPFVEFGFMRRALAASWALAVAAGPVGVLMQLNRMTLVADAMQHAILPGVAVAFLVAGVSAGALAFGGLAGGLIVAGLAGAVARSGRVRADTSFAATFVVALAAGIALLSIAASPVDVMHVLFGNVLAVDDAALLLVAGMASVVVLMVTALYRPLVGRCLDPQFPRPGDSRHLDMLFLGLVVVTLVAGFQALGTLLVLGFLVLPAAAAGLWTRRVWTRMAAGIGVAGLSAVTGLLLSYHADLPSGPAVVLVSGAVYVLSLGVDHVRAGRIVIVTR